MVEVPVDKETRKQDIKERLNEFVDKNIRIQTLVLETAKVLDGKIAYYHEDFNVWDTYTYADYKKDYIKTTGNACFTVDFSDDESKELFGNLMDRLDQNLLFEGDGKEIPFGYLSSTMQEQSHILRMNDFEYDEHEDYRSLTFEKMIKGDFVFPAVDPAEWPCGIRGELQPDGNLSASRPPKTEEELKAYANATDKVIQQLEQDYIAVYEAKLQDKLTPIKQLFEERKMEHPKLQNTLLENMEQKINKIFAAYDAHKGNEAWTNAAANKLMTATAVLDNYHEALQSRRYAALDQELKKEQNRQHSTIRNVARKIKKVIGRRTSKQNEKDRGRGR